MATLNEIRNHLLEKTGKDIFEPHPHLEDILDKIVDATGYGDITDYANLLEEIILFCEEQLTVNGFRDLDINYENRSI